MEDEGCRTLNEVIEELEQLRSIHGGSIEVLYSTGGVRFRAVSFSQAEQEQEGDRNFIQVAGVDSREGAKEAVSKEQCEDWYYELAQIESAMRAIIASMFGFESHIEDKWAKTQLAGLVPLLRFTTDRLAKVRDELDS